MSLLKTYGFKQYLLFGLRELVYRYWIQLIVGSYSQGGEDLVVEKLIGKKKGYYVDVGANDPKRFNNTYRFYKRGWRGINIEPNYNLHLKLTNERPKDINLNLGIGTQERMIFFYQFNPDTISTFSESTAKKYKNMGFALVSRKSIKVVPLRNVFANYLKGKSIDFLSVDTEGFDMQVLQSNNWKKYLPKVVCIEISQRNLLKAESGRLDFEIKEYLISKGYTEYFNNGVNAIFVLTSLV